MCGSAMGHARSCAFKRPPIFFPAVLFSAGPEILGAGLNCRRAALRYHRPSTAAVRGRYGRRSRSGSPPATAGFASDWIKGGVDFVELREKDLDPTALLYARHGASRRARSPAVEDPHQSSCFFSFRRPRGRRLAALLSLCDGIHLPKKPVPEDAKLVREAFRRHGRDGLVSMSSHSVEEIRVARRAGADLVFYAPVFEKFVPGGAFARHRARTRCAWPCLRSGRGNACLRSRRRHCGQCR